MIEPLSPREYQYLRMRARGLTLYQVGLQMGISEATVKNHLQAVHHKLRVRSTIDALRVVGWLKVPEEEETP